MHICAEHLHKGHELEFDRAVSVPPLTPLVVQNAGPTLQARRLLRPLVSPLPSTGRVGER
jgi:hypothetical protein